MPEEKSGQTASEMLGRAYGAMVVSAKLLKADYHKGRYAEDHYEALEEELAKLMKDTMQLAKTLGWVVTR